jgi:hypothetical protein
VGAYALQQPPAYSITSSARTSSIGEISRPSAFAVLRLMTNSNLVARATGMSAGRRDDVRADKQLKSKQDAASESER